MTGIISPHEGAAPFFVALCPSALEKGNKERAGLGKIPEYERLCARICRRALRMVHPVVRFPYHLSIVKISVLPGPIPFFPGPENQGNGTHSLFFSKEVTMHEKLTRSISSARSQRFLQSALLAVGLILVPIAPALADTTITILSPKENATVENPVTVAYKYHKEGRANHIHVMIDGQFLKVSHHSPITMKLPSGKHTILLQAASAHHDLLDATATVKVLVK